MCLCKRLSLYVNSKFICTTAMDAATPCPLAPLPWQAGTLLSGNATATASAAAAVHCSILFRNLPQLEPKLRCQSLPHLQMRRGAPCSALRQVRRAPIKVSCINQFRICSHKMQLTAGQRRRRDMGSSLVVRGLGGEGGGDYANVWGAVNATCWQSQSQSKMGNAAEATAAATSVEA